MTVRDTGDLKIWSASHKNVPVNCFLVENKAPNAESLWVWEATNFCVQLCETGSGYRLESHNRQDILDVVRALVYPLYQGATENILCNGKNYYWKSSVTKPITRLDVQPAD